MMRNNRTANFARGDLFRVANQPVALNDVIAGLKFRRWNAMSSDYQFPRSDSMRAGGGADLILCFHSPVFATFHSTLKYRAALTFEIAASASFNAPSVFSAPIQVGNSSAR